MKSIAKEGIIVAAFALLITGLSQPAAAQIPGGSPSQYCKQQIEPAFQGVGLPLPHSTCVTLLNGADDGNVSMCKWASDIGAIPSNGYGKCVSGTTDPSVVFQGIYNVLVAHGATSAQITEFNSFLTYWEEATGRTVVINYYGPTGISLAVFAALLVGWFMMKRHRGKVRSALYGC